MGKYLLTKKSSMSEGNNTLMTNSVGHIYCLYHLTHPDCLNRCEFI